MSLIKKNRFSCITRLKIHHQLENHHKELCSTELHWKSFSWSQLHNFIRLEFQKEAWSRDIARIEDGGERCKSLSEETIKKIAGMSKSNRLLVQTSLD